MREGDHLGGGFLHSSEASRASTGPYPSFSGEGETGMGEDGSICIYNPVALESAKSRASEFTGFEVQRSNKPKLSTPSSEC
jgi:hypothetical protein